MRLSRNDFRGLADGCVARGRVLLNPPPGGLSLNFTQTSRYREHYGKHYYYLHTRVATPLNKRALRSYKKKGKRKEKKTITRTRVCVLFLFLLYGRDRSKTSVLQSRSKVSACNAPRDRNEISNTKLHCLITRTLLRRVLPSVLFLEGRGTAREGGRGSARDGRVWGRRKGGGSTTGRLAAILSHASRRCVCPSGVVRPTRGNPYRSSPPTPLSVTDRL